MKIFFISLLCFVSNYSFGKDYIKQTVNAIKETKEVKKIKNELSVTGKNIVKKYALPYELFAITKMGLDKRIKFEVNNNTINIGLKEKSIVYMFNFSF